MSLDTTLARAAARAAADRWQWHYKGCHRCHAAAGRVTVQRGLLCPEGLQLHDDRRTTAAEAKRQAELDKAPSPDQGTLFELPE
jgi:hypothetical protein